MSSIVVICEPPTENTGARVMSAGSMGIFLRAATKAGFAPEDFRFIRLCDPIPRSLGKSVPKRWEHVAPNEERIAATFEAMAAEAPVHCVMTLGALALRMVSGKNEGIMAAAGVARKNDDGLIFPTIGPGMVAVEVSNMPKLEVDFETLMRIKKAGWDPDRVDVQMGEYSYVDDLSDFIDNPPVAVANDCEVHNMAGRDARKWADTANVIVSAGLCREDGKGVVLPGPEYWAKNKAYFDGLGLCPRKLENAWVQYAEIMANPKIRKCGHNYKYDIHVQRIAMGIEVQGYGAEGLLLAHKTDENMRRKGLYECTLRWVKELAGAIEANDVPEYISHMMDCPPERLLPYQAIDVDASFRLCKRLNAKLREDPRAYQVYKRIDHVALLTFVEMEKNGALLDRAALKAFGEKIDAAAERDYHWLVKYAPGRVKIRHEREQQEKLGKHYDQRKALAFTRPAFVRDVLFAKDGFALKPLVFTDGSKDEEDPEKRIPSTSAKKHLPYHMGNFKKIPHVKPIPGSNERPDWLIKAKDKEGQEFDREITVADWLTVYTGYSKMMKLKGTYIGDDGEDDEDGEGGTVSGIYKYMDEHDRIHPTFKLWVAVTGRTASSDPNGQNFPTRGEHAKPYLSIFIAPSEWLVVAADLSQVELRLIADEANEPRMIALYRNGGDIHLETLFNVIGLDRGRFEAGSKQQKKDWRTSAKAVNFGLIYGMAAETFQQFAFTDYGVEFTSQEAQDIHNRYFETYDLKPWHEARRQFAHKHGFVRSQLGGVRHLPDLKSSERWKVSDAERQAINSSIQGDGSRIGTAGVNRLAAQRYDWIKPFLFVHDAAYCYVKATHARRGVEALTYAMSTVPVEKWFGWKPKVPLPAEPDIGISIGDKIELGDWKGKTIADVDESYAKSKKQTPDWLRRIVTEQGIFDFDASLPPVDWNPQVDVVGEEAFWS